jgi:hypothetical protein
MVLHGVDMTEIHGADTLDEFYQFEDYPEVHKRD